MEAIPVDIGALHARSVIRKVSLDELRVDRTYQRDPSQPLVDRIANEWDEVSSELLLVSDRGVREGEFGGLYIVNGQHRSLGARKRGETEVWARVLDLGDVEDPGAIEATFRLRTNVRMADKPQERFKAQLRAGDPESLAIMAILGDFDTEVNDVPVSETGVNAIAAVERLYRVDNGARLRDTLQVIKDTFGYVGGKYASAAMLWGVAWFITKHSDESDRGRFVEKLSEVGLGALGNRARTIQATMGGTLWINYYRSMVDFYNERLHEKSKLEWRHSGAASLKMGTGAWGKGNN